MPYTPPVHRSPASTAPSSPDISRRSSFQLQTQPPRGGRPSLPRSASYLTRQRRTPSASESSVNNVGQPTPRATSEDVVEMVGSGSVRQSPPPVTDEHRVMPNCALISPPDTSSSDDDEIPEIWGRSVETLEALQQAISQMPHKRECSPTIADETRQEEPDARDIAVLSSQAPATSDVMHHSFSTSALDKLALGRRITHARSATEPNVMLSKSAGNSASASDEDSEDEFQHKPQMVRKKSGELVRPALRPSSRRRPSSMPGTPTFSKAVHFDSHLEHVRHFLQVDRPLAVSVGSSPVDNYDSDTEYPFPENNLRDKKLPFEWEITMSNFPTVDTPARRNAPVRLERVWLSSDQKCLIGSVIVANLAFHKRVTCRFTLDYWKTTSEVGAEYLNEVRPRDGPVGYDRFNFSIKLADTANLENKTLFFCIRYNVNGHELWDSNDGTNYQTDFCKKMLPHNGKWSTTGAASRPANGLPRSHRRPSGAGLPRPQSMPSTADEFGSTKIKINFDQSIHDYLGESGPTSLRLKGARASPANFASDNLPKRPAAPSGQAFSNRYDFGKSLTAAVKASKDAMTNKSDSFVPRLSIDRGPADSALRTSSDALEASSSAAAPGLVLSFSAARSASATRPSDNSSVLTPALDPPSATLPSSSYEELVNKYCFFGSKQSSPQLNAGTFRSGRFDGADDAAAQGIDSTTSSAESSPLQFGEASRRIVQRQVSDPNPYFKHASAFVQPQSSSLSVSSLDGSPSPTAAAGSFAPLAGTSPTEFAYPQLPDCFPFFGAEPLKATAIRL